MWLPRAGRAGALGRRAQCSGWSAGGCWLAGSRSFSLSRDGGRCSTAAFGPLRQLVGAQPSCSPSTAFAWQRSGAWPCLDASGARRAAASASRDPDPYQVLGIGRDASAEDIKTAYRKLALKWHPDRNPDKPAAAEAEFKKVSKAYSLLSDPQQRAVFDRFGTADSDVAASGGQARGFTQEEAELIFRQMFGDKPITEIIKEVEKAMLEQQQQMRQAEQRLQDEFNQLVAEAEELRWQAMRSVNPQLALNRMRLAAAKEEQARRVEQTWKATVIQNMQQEQQHQFAFSRLRALDPALRMERAARVGLCWGAAIGAYFGLGFGFWSSVLVYLSTSLLARLAFMLWRRLRRG